MPKRETSQAMMERNKLGSLILKKASEEEISAQRQVLAATILEPQIRAALNHGLTPGRIRRMAEKLATK